MKFLGPLTVLLAGILVPSVTSQALFINMHAARSGTVQGVEHGAHHRAVRQTKNSADQMVHNILQWIQNVYNTNNRKIRQNSFREYLPPSITEKPRPFQPNTQLPVGPGGFTGYPPSGSSPQPPFTDYTRPPPPPIYTTPEGPTTGYPAPGERPEDNGIYPGGYPTGPSGPSGPGYPGPTTGYPGPSTGYPGPSTGYPGPSTGYPGPGPSTGYPGPAPTTGYPGPTTGYPGPSTGYPGPSTGYPGPSTGYPGPTTGYPGPSTGYPGPSTGFPGPSTGYPGPSSTPGSYEPTPGPKPIPTEKPDSDGNESEGTGTVQTTPGSTPDDDEKHPPHIHAIDVECAKDMMTINLEFNKVYNGIIYSKGYYNQAECRYVTENSGQTKYSFTVNLNSCGTQFINAFDTQGQSYLENVLVLQNEASIQEVWDTIRSVRCLWEGNLNKALSVALSVGMLNQEIVTFSGDTAMAKLDIQLGRGPFAPAANGLVKIGETMTLVVSVTGDPGFDIQVRDCRARDSNSQNSIALTDKNGCVLKPKLFGAFQKTRNTGNTGASIIAYAFFNAFKFPDVMDLILECNIELCKTDCEVCPEPNQKTEPGRKRRDVSYGNETISEPVIVGKLLRVILPEDISDENSIISLGSKYNEGICMSTESFVFSSVLLVSLLTVSCVFSAYSWLKVQHLQTK